MKIQLGTILLFMVANLFAQDSRIYSVSITNAPNQTLRTIDMDGRVRKNTAYLVEATKNLKDWIVVGKVNPTDYTMFRGSVGFLPSNEFTTNAFFRLKQIESPLVVTLRASVRQATITQNRSTVYLVDFIVTAGQSDIEVRSLKINLGSQRILFQSILKKIYLFDSSTEISSLDLTPNAITEFEGNYSAVINALSINVEKNTSRIFTILADSYEDISHEHFAIYQFGILCEGLRCEDESGSSHFAPEMSLNVDIIVQ